MAPMASSDSEVKTCSKSCLKNYEALKKQYDDLLVKLSDTGFKAATYKRGLATLEDQIVKYREHEVRFSEEIALLKRSVGSKEYELGLIRTELEKVKQEKEGVDFKIAKFDKSAKDLNEMLESQITDKSKKGVGYHVVPSPHPLILNRPTTLDLSYSGLEEFKEPEVIEYGPRDSSLKSTTGCDKKSENSKKNTDDSLEQHQMTDTQTSSFESPLKVDKDWKEKFFYPANHVESVNQIEKPVKRTVRYAEMYRSQKPRGKIPTVGNEYWDNNKTLFAFGSFKTTDKRLRKCSKEKEESREECSKSRKTKKMNLFWKILSSKENEVLLEENSRMAQITLPVTKLQSVNTASYYCWFKITDVGEKVNAAESLLVVSTEVNAN
ncbi:hypothetical protein Tco_0876778 [Tanacetum coccineum]|uniref:Uncharacterized protein n=1 Tax=Tanacetum coccineum TaxID=301880 RepID=A0ABQ5BW99_9ASTR